MRSVIGSLLILAFAAGALEAQEKPSWRMSGMVYTDYSYNVDRDTAAAGLSETALAGLKDQNGFIMRRIYLTFDADASASVTFRLRFEADEAAKTSNGKTGTFVKDAWLKWKSAVGSNDVIVGIQPTSAFDVSETVWGYRALEKTILDLRGIVSSRDQGVSLKGPLVGDGMVKYWLMFANGSGNSPETDRYKRYSAQIEIHPVSNLIATVYADLAARAPLATVQGTLSNNATVVSGFVGYREQDAYTVGVEGFMRSIDHGYAHAGTYDTKTTTGISLFASYVLSPGIAVVGRYDTYDPNTNSAATGDARGYLLAGLDWRPEQGISVIPNIQLESYQKPANGAAITSALTARLTLAASF